MHVQSYCERSPLLQYRGADTVSGHVCAPSEIFVATNRSIVPAREPSGETRPIDRSSVRLVTLPSIVRGIQAALSNQDRLPSNWSLSLSQACLGLRDWPSSTGAMGDLDTIYKGRKVPALCALRLDISFCKYCHMVPHLSSRLPSLKVPRADSIDQTVAPTIQSIQRPVGVYFWSIGSTTRVSILVHDGVEERSHIWRSRKVRESADAGAGAAVDHLPGAYARRPSTSAWPAAFA